jgi:predicted nucleic acid-binding protein
MTTPAYTCVVDASVAIKLYLNEPLSAEAQALFAQLNDPATVFHVPDLFYVECANILWKQVQRGSCAAVIVPPSLRTLGQLRLRSTPTRDLFADAADLALAHGISAYDACYVALAQRLGGSLITADQKLESKLAAANLPVVWLGNGTPPAAPTGTP